MNRLANKVLVTGAGGIARQDAVSMLVKILAKLGLLTEDLDYHLLRAAMVIKASPGVPGKRIDLPYVDSRFVTGGGILTA